MKYLTPFVACFLIATGCSHKEPATTRPPSATNSTPSTEAPHNLTREEAVDRARRIRKVEYALTVELNETPVYTGTQKIRFDLSDAQKDLRLDFFKGTVRAASVNGQKAQLSRKPHQVILPKSLLKNGRNTVEIEFTTEMQNDGTGLSRFVDPVDKAVYIHSQFQAFRANKFMPCFDQPDLKATLEMTVTAPAAWKVVTTTRERSITKVGETAQKWVFPKTPQLSTYLFSLHAGPFHVWEDSYQRMKLRLFARPSLVPHVNTKLWFDTTKQGLSFFNRYFDYPYPFHKYDQLIVPNFSAGAMENVGAVTFNERYVPRGRMSREEEIDVAAVILHEMAHMWFGNLVTMNWWNDLWLNESFATYMASYAMYEVTPYKEAWREFFQGSKQWAYFQDELSTTHPIESEVKDTVDAFANFNGITYGKGASAIKQLSHWMGAYAFRDGMREYFKTYAYKTTELKDFIDTLQKYSGKNLSRWSDAWLRQAGLDTIAMNFRCEGGRLQDVTTAVKPSVPGIFRPQAIQIALFKQKGGALVSLGKKNLSLDKPDQVTRMSGECPDLLMPNHGDHGYGKFVLDEKSVATVTEKLSDLKDPLDRMMLWSNLWQMVRDQRLPLTKYADLALRHTDREKDVKTLTQIFRSIGHRDAGSVIAYWPVDTPELRKDRDTFVSKLETMGLRRLKASAPGSDEQALWWDMLVKVAEGPSTVTYILEAFNKPQSVPSGLQIDQDRRWAVLRRICSLGHDSCDSLLEKEKIKDSSDRGFKSYLAAQALRPDFENKKKIFYDVLNKDELTYHDKRMLSGNLFPFEQRNLAERMEEDYFAFVKANKNSPRIEFVQMVTGHFMPVDCSPRQSRKVQSFMESTKDLPTPLYRRLRESLDEDLRCQKIRATSFPAAVGTE